MNQLAHFYLSTLCRIIKGVTRAVVYTVASSGESFAPSAQQPEDIKDFKFAERAVQAVLAKKQCLLMQRKNSVAETGESLEMIACPLFVNDRLHGVVVIEMTCRTSARQQETIRQMQGAAIWFETMARQHAVSGKSELATIVEFVAACLEQERFEAAATDVVTDLSIRFSCDRVSIGFLSGREMIVEAVSRNAGFDRKSGMICDISEAMYEAIEQDCSILYPQTNDAVLLSRCHAVLADEHGSGSILTVPFGGQGKVNGAVLIERSSDNMFDQKTREYFEQVVAMIGPILAVRRRDEQWLPLKVSHSIKQLLSKIFGPGHVYLKFGLIIVTFCALFLAFMSGEYRVTGKARLEALIQRVVVAPQDGYIAGVNVRPGDLVQKGKILGDLDDKDLELERRKWSSQLEQLLSEHRDALARHDRSKVGIINAKILQARARLNLVREQLARTRLTAPFDGLIVSGDLSQSLGAPVERGQVLFTIAPLDAYRVILKVDERDIGDIRKGQPGSLVLSGMPGHSLPFTVNKITPVSKVEEGRNFFQVEAGIKEKSDLLRPGMEGVAKIDIDRRKLLWIWTHRLIDWLRLSLWSWRL